MRRLTLYSPHILRRINRIFAAVHYLYNHKEWPCFTWDKEQVSAQLVSTRYKQGLLLGQMSHLGFDLKKEANLQTLTLDVIKTSEIEGEILDREQVRSSIARRLGIDSGGTLATDRHVEGIVEMMLDLTGNFQTELDEERLFAWHASLFPTGRSGMFRIKVGSWRENAKDSPMLVVSGAIGKETIHFQAPDSALVKKEMDVFFRWFNTKDSDDPVIKAAIAHLWFVTIHPFADGNGRIGRAIADLQLARADNTSSRFYSMSAQIRKERTGYYNILQQTQQSNLDITKWLVWFLACMSNAIDASEQTLSVVITKAKFWETNTGISFNARQRTMLDKLLIGFEGKLTSTKWAKITKASPDTALRDINDLLQRGILIKEEGGGRSTSYNLKK